MSVTLHRSALGSMNYSFQLTFTLIAAFSLLVSCQSGDSDSITESQWQQLESAYVSISKLYEELEQGYNSEAEGSMKEPDPLYSALQNMRMQLHNTTNR